jgi:hypothetical protein
MRDRADDFNMHGQNKSGCGRMQAGRQGDNASGAGFEFVLVLGFFRSFEDEDENEDDESKILGAIHRGSPQ